MSVGTAEALDVLNHHRVTAWAPGLNHFVGKWTVLPFLLEHDAAEPFGFLIARGEDRLLFIPDTAWVESRFFGVTTIAIECNHIADILSKNIQEGHLPAVVGRRVRHNHMSLETVISMLQANDLSKCRAIYLLHLSDGNSDERRMKEEVQAATGIMTIIC